MVHMITITNHTIQKLDDPTGILLGDRFEFHLHIEVPEDDELFTEKGLLLRVIYVSEEANQRIAQYHFLEKDTGEYIDFGLEEDEEEMISNYCRDHIPNG
jgi:hypothetical protein